MITTAQVPTQILQNLLQSSRSVLTQKQMLLGDLHLTFQSARSSSTKGLRSIKRGDLRRVALRLSACSFFLRVPCNCSLNGYLSAPLFGGFSSAIFRSLVWLAAFLDDDEASVAIWPAVVGGDLIEISLER